MQELPAETPYFPMLAAAYFSAFIVTILCFPALPSPSFKLAGIVWSIGLAFFLTFLSSFWCWVCLGAHGCHLLMWIVWKPSGCEAGRSFGVKLSLVFTSAIAAMALFSTLNVTFLLYGLNKPSSSLVKKGSLVKTFSVETIEKKEVSDALFGEYGGTILNFVSSNCPYCREQLPMIDSLAAEYRERGFRFVSISPKAAPDLHALGAHLEWAEDTEGELAQQFGVQGYPTLILINPEGRVVKTWAGASSSLEKDIKKQLK